MQFRDAFQIINCSLNVFDFVRTRDATFPEYFGFPE